MSIANPLHTSRPTDAETIFKGGYRLVHQPSLELVNFGSVSLRLTATRLWLNDELTVPISSIISVDVLEKGWLFKRHAVQIVYRNPVDGQNETVAVAKVDFLGLYKRDGAEELNAKLQTLIKDKIDAAAASPEIVPPTDDDKPDGRCEACQAQPAYYVSHIFLVSAFLFAYRSPERRRVHCSKCLMKTGLINYLVTACVGWTGIGILQWPFVLYQSSMNMKPVIGSGAYVLAGVPFLAVVGLIVWWFGLK